MTRPDIAGAARAVVRHSHNPCERRWVAIEMIFAYLNQARSGHQYERGSRLSLIIFADTDYARQATDRRSISGLAVILRGAAVCAISRA